RRDDWSAAGPEVAAVLVALALPQRHCADPVQERGVVEWLRHGGEGGVLRLLAVEPRVGEDLVAAVPLPAALVRVLQEAAGAKIALADPRLHRRVEVVPQRAADDTAHEMDRFEARHGVEA